MVVVMQHQFPLIVYVEVFIFFIFLCVAVEERNIFQTVPINVVVGFISVLLWFSAKIQIKYEFNK